MTANGFTISSSLPTEEKTALMSNAALGCYVKLMCFAWREGSIPNDIASLARLCGETPAALQAVWHQIRPCFAEDVFLPGRLVHDEIEGQRATHKASHPERPAAGAIGAERRWIIIAKQRIGPTGRIGRLFEKGFSRFKSYLGALPDPVGKSEPGFGGCSHGAFSMGGK